MLAGRKADAELAAATVAALGMCRAWDRAPGGRLDGAADGLIGRQGSEPGRIAAPAPVAQRPGGRWYEPGPDAAGG
ncbi:hypothetical protein FHU33_4056 [Blastococcus colisei]|uniref:Uncharacterized protein n=1 Tax=Blastococcus colisei TaxID=1564162 RepID=A0A543NZX8_9ACTN|nr:hypothetical protein FHU33_4056 [Blastococcus colisei]